MNNIIFAKDTDHFTNGGLITDKPCICCGFLLGTDSANDPEIVIWNNGDEEKAIVPKATYDASALGLNGFQGQWRFSEAGLYLKDSCAGTFVVVPMWKEWFVGGFNRD